MWKYSYKGIDVKYESKAIDVFNISSDISFPQSLDYLLVHEDGDKQVIHVPCQLNIFRSLNARDWLGAACAQTFIRL